MKELIVFAFNEENLNKKLISAGISLETFIITSNWRAVEKNAIENRPKVILIDGGLSNELITDCLKSVSMTTSNFKIPPKLLMFEENKTTPGVTFIGKLEKLKEYL
jgi:hypothetical protein